MRIIYFHIILIISITTNCTAQKVSSNANACLYYNNGLNYLKARNFEDAIEEFREAVALDKTNVVLNTQYAFAFFINKQNGNAAIVIDEVMKLPNANEDVFILACQIYSAKNEYKQALEAIEMGIEKFPISGNLICEKANLLYEYKKDEEAIILWQTAIDMQPNFAAPYYGIAKALDTGIASLPKTILYAETFLLAEPYSIKATEMKKLIYNCYKVMYTDLFKKNITPSATIKKNIGSNAGDDNKLYRIIKTNKYLLIDGISIENICQLRKTCIADWERTQAQGTMPSVLAYHQRLMHEQLFDTYNQWLLGNAANENQYKKWATDHEDALDLLHQFLKENKYIIQ